MKNTFGQNVAVTLFGESHGEAIGAVLDGLAPGAGEKPLFRLGLDRRDQLHPFRGKTARQIGRGIPRDRHIRPQSAVRGNFQPDRIQRDAGFLETRPENAFGLSDLPAGAGQPDVLDRIGDQSDLPGAVFARRIGEAEFRRGSGRGKLQMPHIHSGRQSGGNGFCRGLFRAGGGNRPRRTGGLGEFLGIRIRGVDENQIKRHGGDDHSGGDAGGESIEADMFVRTHRGELIQFAVDALPDPGGGRAGTVHRHHPRHGIVDHPVGCVEIAAAGTPFQMRPLLGRKSIFAVDFRTQVFRRDALSRPFRGNRSGRRTRLFFLHCASSLCLVFSIFNGASGGPDSPSIFIR